MSSANNVTSPIWLGSRLLNPGKTTMIDCAFEHLNATSFADLGGVWGVEGGYTFYTLQKYSVERAFLVDVDVTSIVESKKAKFPNLTLVYDAFGKQSVADKIGNVDVVFLFDVLLHQASPDWDQILEIYSKVCRCFLIYNQQYPTLQKTIRLPDLGREEYFRHVPSTCSEHPMFQDMFDRPNEIDPRYEKSYRDSPGPWQWGITNLDLMDKMESLGFSLHWQQKIGTLIDPPMVEDRAFIFVK